MKKIAILSFIFGLTIIIILAVRYSPLLSKNTEYDLQLGYATNQELPKISATSDHFKNTSPLVAMAIYPDHKESLHQAQIYVTRRGDSSILQSEKMSETADLAAFEMRLKNMEWKSGEYTLYFKRGAVTQKSLDFTLY